MTYLIAALQIAVLLGLPLWCAWAIWRYIIAPLRKGAK